METDKMNKTTVKTGIFDVLGSLAVMVVIVAAVLVG
jgi:hypothetical protein